MSRKQPKPLKECIYFGETLKALRVSKGITRVELADVLGYSDTFLRDVENGDRRVLYKHEIDKVADFLKLDQSERELLFEAEGVSSGQLPCDMQMYILEHEELYNIIRIAMRH